MWRMVSGRISDNWEVREGFRCWSSTLFVNAFIYPIPIQKKHIPLSVTGAHPCFHLHQPKIFAVLLYVAFAAWWLSTFAAKLVTYSRISWELLLLFLGVNFFKEPMYCWLVNSMISCFSINSSLWPSVVIWYLKSITRFQSLRTAVFSTNYSYVIPIRSSKEQWKYAN